MSVIARGLLRLRRATTKIVLHCRDEIVGAAVSDAGRLAWRDEGFKATNCACESYGGALHSAIVLPRFAY